MRLFAALILLPYCVLAQPWLKKTDSIAVYESSVKLKNPWAGGLNFCQFSTIDLNQDGIKDLFVFDKTGGRRITTYINNGTAGTVDYVHAPEYQTRFPWMYEWALLVDYNCDGKEDIFTYYAGGFSVYKNISTLATGLQFTLVKERVKSSQFSMNLNIYTSPVDIPAFVDVDNDGDIDVLTFHIGGTIVEYHKNLSKETYGHCDSLTFLMKNQCFGYFAENAFNNNVTLDDTCSLNVSSPEGIGTQPAIYPQHAGSSVFAFDKDGDGDIDIALGDISFKNMVLLTNGGTTTANKMTSSDIAFPSNTTSVDISVFPAAYFLDINNDGKKDMLVSPNAPNVSENFNSVWYYSNNATTASPVFVFQEKNFLQKEMIETGEGNYPVFFDYNKDGKLDLVIGNFGYFLSSGGYESKLSLYENTGTSTVPSYSLITRDYCGLSSLGINGIAPTFGDLDNDGDKDMIVGDFTGEIHYLIDTSTGTNPASFVLAQANYFSIDVGQFSAPQLIDINRDGKLDLLIGEQGGNLNYFENTGTAAAAIFASAPTNANFGGVKVNQHGYITGFSTPFLFDVSGNYKLLIGSEMGYLHMYDSIDGNLSGNFKLIDSMYLDIFEGHRTAPYGADINNDGYIDVVIGNYSGGSSLYLGQANNPFSVNEKMFTPPVFAVYPNPAKGEFFIDVQNQLSEAYHVSLINTMGQTVLTISSSNEKQIPISINGLPSGIYFVKVSNEKNNSVQKIIVSN